VRIVVPGDVTPAEKELFEKLAEISDFTPEGRGAGKQP
jgi:hypothetical protein